MNEDILHHTVKEFRDFVNEHPLLIKEIREGNSSWQEYYEKWTLLGEDDPSWNKYTNETIKKETKVNESEILGQLMQLTEKVDINRVQKEVKKFNHTINVVQDILSDFLETKKSKDSPERKHEAFNWFRD